MADLGDYATHPLASGHPPAWADAWGQDRYGVFVGFSVGEVSQKLRWIVPGRFKMGSSETEAGRDDDEGPQHGVTLSQGYWLFDTPCTQGLWEAVMGENPSRFQDARRPVENVSWDDVQAFLQRINTQAPGLALVLPSEAQWEYACRAGTTTATYAGDLEIVGDRNAPVLDEIAWYGGNSGVEYDLEEGHDSRDWEEKQYPHQRAGTRRVGEKTPNGWGLYDMLGNVWEWCADGGMRTYHAEPVIDPADVIEGASGRVLRGGSWNDDARLVRAAARNDFPPVTRDDLLGFRCARVQVGAEPAERSALRQAERRSATAPSGGAKATD